MNGPQETGLAEYAGWLAAFAAFLVTLKKLVPKADPRLLFVWLIKPLMHPVIDRLDRFEIRLERIQRVVDGLPGADAAHALIRAEDDLDALQHKRWEQA